jgi:hypothetical protein
MLVVFVVSAILERYGMTLPVALRRMRLFFSGNYRPALTKSKTRHFVDRGGF